MPYSKDIYKALIDRATASGDLTSAAALGAVQNNMLGNTVQVGADGKAPSGLSVGNKVVTGGGIYTITGINPDGTYQTSSPDTSYGISDTLQGVGDIFKSYTDENKVSDTYDSLLDSIINRKAFSYDPTTDPSYQALATQYTNKGKLAMQDTLGEVAALTGGLPSSAAVSAAGQANNEFMSELSGIIPTLEENAYERYQDDYATDLDTLSMMATLMKNEAASKDTSPSSGPRTSEIPDDTESSLFEDMKASGNPYTYLSTNYKKYGVAYTGLTGVYAEYQDWLENQSNNDENNVINSVGNVGMATGQYESLKKSLYSAALTGDINTVNGIINSVWSRLSGKQQTDIQSFLSRYVDLG